MTGEITLRGQVLPVGGIQEKSARSKDAQALKKSFLCERNRQDIEEIDDRYIKGPHLYICQAHP